MTPKETDKLKKQIADIKRALATEKRKFGAYDDSRGMRYYPTKVYIKLQDFKGGLTYTQWFNKNFSDDCGFPDFLFEWTIILFKTENLKDAEIKAFQTFCSNTYLFDKFFGRPVIPVNKYEFSNIDCASYTDNFMYSCSQPELTDFSEWLRKYIVSEKFVNLSRKFIDLNKRIKTERDKETRSYVLEQIWQLENELK